MRISLPDTGDWPFGDRAEIDAHELTAYLAAQGRMVFVPPMEETEPDWMTSEKKFQQKVTDFAREHGWEQYHTWKSANSNPGYPDLCLCRVGNNGIARLIYAELKPESGRVTPSQQRWLDVLSKVPGAEVYLWRPADWESIQEILR